MKVLGFTGSAREKSISTRLLREMLSVYEGEGWEVSTFDLAKAKITECNACDECREHGRCVFRDDFDKLEEDLLKADAIILATPIHFYALPARVKRFIDRCQPYWHLRHTIQDQELLTRKPCRFTLAAAAGGAERPKLLTASRLPLKMWCNTMGYTYGPELLVSDTDGMDDARLQEPLAEARALARQMLTGGIGFDAPEKALPPRQHPFLAAFRASFMALCGVVDRPLPLSEQEALELKKKALAGKGPVVVYKAHPGSELQELIKILRRDSINPQVLDQCDPTLMYASGWTYQVRVAVAPEDVPAATAAIREWTRRTAAGAERHHRAFVRQVKWAVLPLVAAVIAVLIFSGNPGQFPWGILFLLWIAAIILTASLKKWWRE